MLRHVSLHAGTIIRSNTKHSIGTFSECAHYGILDSLQNCIGINLLKLNDIYICRTAALASRRYILNIYSTNIHTEYFKHAA